MSTHAKRIEDLYERWLKDETDAAENRELFSLLKQMDLDEALAPQMKLAWDNAIIKETLTYEEKKNLAETIIATYPPETEENSIAVHRVHFLKTAWFKYAAAILLIVTGVSVYYLFNTPKTSTEMARKGSPGSAIIPGSDRAVLTLSDGRRIVLDDSGNQLITDGKTSINKNSGVLTYNSVLTTENSVVSYNTMTTPRGGQYKVVLPDGSEAWLNSASSLRFPTSFHGNTRLVELTGEGYFEIRENKTKPFIVKTKKIDVTVLGTEFNVNAFEDEPVVATTLVHGSVRVGAANETLIIRPGQQAAIELTGSKIRINTPKMDEVLAWRNGKFKFEKVPIERIMRQISRWYDVDVTYRGDVSKIQLSGSLLRTETPYALLDAIEFSDDVHFEIEGKKIIVIPGQRTETSN